MVRQLPTRRRKGISLPCQVRIPYLRKIAIDGCIIKLELPELRDMVSLLRCSNNNLNQIARRVNETGRFYAADMEDMLARQEQLWQAANEIITRLASIG